MSNMTIQEIKALSYGIVKYVRIGNEFRFGDINQTEHRSLVQPNETAISAGYFAFDNESKIFKVYGLSMSLSLEPADDDKERIIESIS